ncbi:MAG: hypothetical protein ACC682_10960 [Gemmatimonadota bacterium]
MTRVTYRTAGSAALVLAASLPLFARPLDAQSDAERLLRTVADASKDDLEALRAGIPFVRTVRGDDRSQLTLVYAVRVSAPVQFVFDQARLHHLLVDDAEGHHARGVFADPPTGGDLAALTLDRRDIRDLERCRRSDCGLKLSGETIDRLQREVDWSARDAKDEANRFFRRELLASLVGYSAGGAAASLVYADKAVPLAVADGFDALLEDAEYLRELDPEFHRYLGAFPDVVSPDIDDAFTWTVEDLGVKSVVSLNHIVSKSRGASGSALIGIKRVYANHYFQAGLRILVLSPASGDPTGADTYVTVISRLQFDGELGGIRRTAIERRLEMNAERVLAQVRDQLESRYAQQ